MPSLEIRPLTEEYWLPAALLHRALTREIRIPSASLKSILAIFSSDWLEDGEGLVLTENGRLTGYAWARDMLWHGRERIHTGLFLSRSARTPDRYTVLTNALVNTAARLARTHKRRDAVNFYRSVDTIHPPVLRAAGYRDLPTTMIGFGHDLRRIPALPCPAGIEIRPARHPDEVPALQALGQECFDDPESQGHAMHRDRWDLIAGELAAHPEQLLVAIGGGRPVGYAVITVQRNRSRCATMDECAVAPAWRHRGIASHLVSRILAYCRRRRLHQFITSEWSTSPVNSRLWRLGFRPDAVRSYSFFGRPLL